MSLDITTYVAIMVRKLLYISSFVLTSVYSTSELAVGGKLDLQDEAISVSVTVSYNGTVARNEVSQLFVQYPEAADELVRLLRRFKQIMI